MPDTPRLDAIRTADVPPRARTSGYPAEFLVRVAGRDKRPLGDIFGLTTFGVNLTRLAPGAWSALHHRHGSSDVGPLSLRGRLAEAISFVTSCRQFVTNEIASLLRFSQ